MDSEVVISILARCLLDTTFLQRVACDPASALADYPLDERSQADFLQLDVERVRNFAGFIAKVQHSYLWEAFPYTRALLKLYQIEIAVFVEYLPTHQRIHAEGAAREQKIASFVAFLHAYIDARGDARFPALRDLLTHERLLWELSQALGAGGAVAAPLAAAALDARQVDRLVPVVRGALRLGRFDYDPAQVIAGLREGLTDLSPLEARRRWLGYWAASAAGQPHVFELDDLAAALLSLVDGRGSIGTIIARVRERLPPGVRPAQLRPVFHAAFAQGLLSAGAARPS